MKAAWEWCTALTTSTCSAKLRSSCCPPAWCKDESARRRFRKEALTLARLNHPNIGTLHGFEADGDVDFLVMEYVPGITLASKLARGPMRESELLEYAIQLASALDEAHKQGVIHRDLKPSNILITPGGQLKILDFGLARLLTAGDDSDTDTGNLTVAGTLPYVSPEELSGAQALDSRSDLYSVRRRALRDGHRQASAQRDIRGRAARRHPASLSRLRCARSIPKFLPSWKPSSAKPWTRTPPSVTRARAN